MGNLAVNAVLEGINASQEKRDWTISHQKTSPELVIRESTRAVSLSSADD
jgi:DNA-binding LacI/PurR family transcriptional regulator